MRNKNNSDLQLHKQVSWIVYAITYIYSYIQPDTIRPISSMIKEISAMCTVILPMSFLFIFLFILYNVHNWLFLFMDSELMWDWLYLTHLWKCHCEVFKGAHARLLSPFCFNCHITMCLLEVFPYCQMQCHCLLCIPKHILAFCACLFYSKLDNNELGGVNET
jgi:hypothetical protein